MLYYFVKYPMSFAFLIYFRKVFRANLHTVPKGKPVIFAVNHPTAFIDPVMVATYMGPTVHFILRGDVFTSRIIKWILASLRTVPIFRFRDGFESLRRNQETFDFCYRLLRDNKPVLILAEGHVLHAKRLKPVQKGVARMAFGAYDAYGQEDTLIVPVGVNYTDSDRFRSYAMIEYGEAIALKDYLELYREDERKAIKQLTDEIQKRMRRHIVHIEDDEDAPKVDQLLEINRNSRREPSLPPFSRDRQFLHREIRVAEAVNAMSDEEKEDLFDKLEVYQSDLDAQQVADLGVAQPRYYNFFNSLSLVLGFLPFVVGVALNALPVWFASHWTDKNIRRIESRASILVGLGKISYELYWILCIVLAAVLGGWPWWLLALLMPALGYFSVQYRDLYERWSVARRASRLGKEKLLQLQHRRNELLTALVSQ